MQSHAASSQNLLRFLDLTVLPSPTIFALIAVMGLLAAVAIQRWRNKTSPNDNSTAASPPVQPSKLGTPPAVPVGAATVCSTFCLGADCSVHEPAPPLYSPPRLPHDLGHQRYAQGASASDTLAVRVLNLDGERVWHALAKWHAHRGTLAAWDASAHGTQFVCRRSTLCGLWGTHGGDAVRVRRRGALVFLDRADKASMAKRAKTLYGRRFELATTLGDGAAPTLPMKRRRGAVPAAGRCFMAAVRVAIGGSSLMLLTEVDCVGEGSWLATGGDASRGGKSEGQLQGLGVMELKSRTCSVRSGEFAASHAKELWAQSMLGAVERLVLGVRAGARLCSLQSLTQQELVEAAQRADEDWRPEAAVEELERRLQWVMTHAVDGGDHVVWSRSDVDGGAQLLMRERKSRQMMASLPVAGEW